jgi:predicted component of type VI protein secretion system
LPDFAHVSAGDMRARDDLAAQMSRTIEAFEPRLRDVRVILEPHPSGTRALMGAIVASMVVGVMVEPVSFPLEVHTRSRTAELENAEAFAQVS